MLVPSNSSGIFGSYIDMIYLGGLQVHKLRLKPFHKFSNLQNVNQLWTFLGLCNYYQRFVKGFNSIGKLLTWLTYIDEEFIWGET
jgi:hypothetical protein